MLIVILCNMIIIVGDMIIIVGDNILRCTLGIVSTINYGLLNEFP